MARELHTESVTIRLTPRQRRLVVKLAEREERTISSTVRRLISLGLKAMGEDGQLHSNCQASRGDN